SLSFCVITCSEPACSLQPRIGQSIAAGAIREHRNIRTRTCNGWLKLIRYIMTEAGSPLTPARCLCWRDAYAGAMLMPAQCLCRRDAMRPPARPPQEMMMRRLVVPFVPFGALLFVATAGVALA